MILAVATSPSVDVTYVVAEFREGVQVRPQSVHRSAGGKAINAARAAAALGGDVRVVAALGGATGGFISEQLAARGIPLAVAATGTDTRTCVSVFATATGSLTEIYENAAPIADAWPALLELIDQQSGVRTIAGWMLLSGSLPATGSERPIVELAERAAAHGLRLAVDTHGPALRAVFDLPRALAPALVKVNRAEAAAALERDATQPLGELAAELRDRTGTTAVVTDGRAGAAAADHDGLWLARLDDIDGGFPVGSGDCFLGALVVALDQSPASGMSVALRLATAAAAANALVPGAAEFSVDTVARLQPEVQVGLA